MIRHPLAHTAAGHCPGVEAWPFEVGQQRRQPREADEKFARARMVLGGHGLEPV